MTEQTIDIRQEKMPPLSISKDHVTNVSYALIPKEAKIEVKDNEALFKFKYPITEDEFIERSFDRMGLKYFLEKSTKKILAIKFFNSYLTNYNLDDFDKTIRYLRKEQLRNSVKENYNFIQRLVHYFFTEFDKKDFNNLDQ